MTNFKEEVNRKRFLKEYLKALSSLSRTKPEASSLLSLEETTRIGNSAKQTTFLPKKSLVLKFSEKDDAKFKELVKKLFDSYSGSVYIWTHLTNFCGVCVVPSLLDFNFSFDFFVNKHGIIVLLATDLSGKIVLDFSRDEDDKEIIEIEIMGKNWGSIKDF